MKKYLYTIVPALALVAFIIWTILVKTVDVKFINDVGYLGFYNSNIAINEWVKGFNNDTYHLVSTGLFIASFATALPLGIAGIVQWIKRKSIKKVDPILFALLGVYISIGVFYVLFELFRINCSPLSTKGNLKASYPSSHIFGAVTVFTVNMMAYGVYFKFKKPVYIISIITVLLFIFVTVFTRLLSGRHYFSDVIGSLFLAFTLITTYQTVLQFLKDKGIEIKK